MALISNERSALTNSESHRLVLPRFHNTQYISQLYLHGVEGLSCSGVGGEHTHFLCKST